MSNYIKNVLAFTSSFGIVYLLNLFSSSFILAEGGQSKLTGFGYYFTSILSILAHVYVFTTIQEIISDLTKKSEIK